eukprot:TRINITY_DN13982_c0_g1_i1.p1 TRINITY_DN13982_c0_g1~~TRINITY_DN13982_c0_g1_i1.p1  ORF type:complete len:210 (+),score=28.53 TRINITY_DN13982_c0_g1_i1:273-902(+)
MFSYGVGALSRIFRPPGVFEKNGSKPKESKIWPVKIDTKAGKLSIRLAQADDGKKMWQLAGKAGLDLNSPYMYNLYCRDFAGTSAVAHSESGEIVGYILGHQPPSRPETYFVWQIGVSPDARKSHLASHMLDAMVASCGTTFLEASVTPSNAPSNALFQSFAKTRQCKHTLTKNWMSEEDFPKASGSHEAEDLYRIGPFEAYLQKLTSV